MKKIVITGATSFLGRNILERFQRNGEYNIVIFVRKQSTNLAKIKTDRNTTIVYGSLEEIDIIEKKVSGVDYWIHLGWDGSGYKGRADDITQQKNVEYAKKAMKLAHSLGCEKFIFTGSQAEYGNMMTSTDESAECGPVSAYGRAKYNFATWALDYVTNTNMQYLHLRIFSVYGHGDRKGSLIDLCIDGFNNGKVVNLGPCEQMWNYLFIDDFSEIVYKLVEMPVVTGIYNIASDDIKPLSEFVKSIYNLSNKSGEYILGEFSQNPEKSPNLIPNITKLESAIGEIDFTCFEDGIQEIMVKEGYLR